MKQILAIMAIILLMSAPVIAQEIDYCEGDFDCDTDVDGSDASVFKLDFGRSYLKNPCPSDGPAPVPRTSQLTQVVDCDDGSYQCGIETISQRYTQNDDGTVTDKLTGLIWLEDANCFDLRIWEDAIKLCSYLQDGSCGLSDGSYEGDWRLPNVKELQSLIDYGHNSPALPSNHPFNNIQSLNYWSSTTVDERLEYAWCVDMHRGNVNNCNKNNETYLWPVKGGRCVNQTCIASPRFTDNANGTITDNDSGLIWLQNASCFGENTFIDAQNMAAGLESGFCGLSDGSSLGDWRVPTKEEWDDFVCTQYTNPAICDTLGVAQGMEGDPFNNVVYDVYWSSTSAYIESAYGINLADGSWLINGWNYTYQVWPVRGGL